jgi:hypothetical protein
MEFEKCNLSFLMGMFGLIVIGSLLVLTNQDGYMIKGIIFLIGIAMGLPISLPQQFGGKKKEE